MGLFHKTLRDVEKNLKEAEKDKEKIIIANRIIERHIADVDSAQHEVTQFVRLFAEYKRGLQVVADSTGSPRLVTEEEFKKAQGSISILLKMVDEMREAMKQIEKTGHFSEEK